MHKLHNRSEVIEQSVRRLAELLCALGIDDDESQFYFPRPTSKWPRYRRAA